MLLQNSLIVLMKLACRYDSAGSACGICRVDWAGIKSYWIWQSKGFTYTIPKLNTVFYFFKIYLTLYHIQNGWYPFGLHPSTTLTVQYGLIVEVSSFNTPVSVTYAVSGDNNPVRWWTDMASPPLGSAVAPGWS